MISSPTRALACRRSLHRLTRVVAVACLATGCAYGSPRDIGPATVDEEPLDPVGGVHLRLMTPHGPVHVLQPRGYDPATAGTLVYVHGYYTDIDSACRQQHLSVQFDNSNTNALFISPEAPGEDTEAVRWTSLRELLDTVSASGVELPRGAVVAMAHSGGFRTLANWLDSGLLDTVVLLDGLYGNEANFQAWVDDSTHEHHLVLVGFDTTNRIERFVSGRDDVGRAALPLPPQVDELKSSRLVFLRSTFGHMELVTEGHAIPSVLRLTRLPAFDPGSTDAWGF